MRTARWIGLFPALALAAAACVGNLGDDGEGGPGDGDGPVGSTPQNFVCDPNVLPETLPLRRLTQVQYRNTLRDLVGFAAGDQADAVLAEVAPTYDRLVDDLRIGDDPHYAGFTRLDQAVQQAHVDAAYEVAAAVGTALTAPGRLEVVVGSCATDGDPGNDADCAAELIRRFGERALRRAITDDDVAFYAGPAGATPHEAADYADVIALMLNAPHALYFVEHGTDEVADRAPLDDYELASRLSYHFWQTMPDEELLEAARSGALQTDDGFQTQLDRVYADPRTEAALTEFFGQWLENSTLDPLDSRVGTPAFDAMRGDFTPTPELRDEMWAEVTDSALYYATDGQSTFADFVRSDRSFARSQTLASIYEVEPWDGQGEPPVMTQPARAGLITRAAYVATGSANTRPIMKGVFMRKALLCDPINPAPPDAPTEVEFQPGMSTREVVDELTGSGSCASCHNTLINGLGFPTENFDPLGRFRGSEQALFDSDTGESLGTATVETSSVPRVDTTDETPVADAGELTDRILESPKPYACFTRQYYRFTFGRREDLDRDACALAEVKDALDEGASLADVLRTIATTAQFRQRTFIED